MSQDPVEEYFRLKHAADAQGGGWKPALRNAGIQLGVGLAAAALPAAANKAYNAITKNRSYDSMMKLNPDLAAAHQENPGQFSAFYDSLHRMNPDFAQDPIVSGTYLRQMTANPASAGKVLVESLGGAKNMPRSPLGETMKGMASTLGKSVAEDMRPGKTKETSPEHEQMRKNIEDMNLEMQHQEVMQQAHSRGFI